MTGTNGPRRPKPKSKTGTILGALRRQAGLTAVEGFALGDAQLACTVMRLRRAGYVIDSHWHSRITRYGKQARYVRYFLIQP